MTKYLTACGNNTRRAMTLYRANIQKLTSINRARNRIAHHEPICFITPHAISTQYAEQKYNQIIEVLLWLGINPESFFFGVDGFLKEKHHLDKL